MTLIEAKQRLLKLDIPVLQTHEVAKTLDLSNAQASLILHRLQKFDEVSALKKGLWLIDKKLSAFAIGELLARPYPAYVSLQSALYLHEMISQIPETVFLVTLGRTRKISFDKTIFSLHQIDTLHFEGFQQHAGFHLATPEKALFDLFYFSGTRTNIFKALPELQLPKNFKPARLRRWCKQINNPRQRSFVMGRVEDFLLGA